MRRLGGLQFTSGTLWHKKENLFLICRQGLYMHQHMLVLIDTTPSEAPLTFASCQRISEPIGHHIVPPTCMSCQPYLSPFSHSASLPPLSASILFSQCTHTAHTHSCTDTQTSAPASAHTPFLPRLPSFPRVFRPPDGSDASQGCRIFSGLWN